MKNSKIVKAYDKIVLDEFSKQRIFSEIKEKAYSKKSDYKRKVWNYKKLSSIVAVCACAIMVFKIPGVQASLQNTISKFASWISGNSKDDYYEEVDTSVGDNNFKLKIINAQRRYNEVKLRYEIEFPIEIEQYINLDDYTYKEVSTETESYLTRKDHLDMEIFESRNIYINDVSYDYINSDEYEYDAICYYARVNNVGIEKNKLIQELVVMLNDENSEDDINIKLKFKTFKINNEIYDADLKQEYTLKYEKYKDSTNEDIKINPISYEVKIDEKNKIDFYGYSYTKTGIKLYSKFTGEEDFLRIIRLKVKDNYGTEYLMYPWWTSQKFLNGEIQYESILDRIFDEEKKDILIFEIYDGLADWNNEYPDYWNDNIKSLNIKVFVEDAEEFDKFIQMNNESEFNINFEENN